MFYDAKPIIQPRKAGTVLSWATLFRWIQLLTPEITHKTNLTAEQDLLRLAQTSPHLLPDLGFRHDRSRHFPGREIWVSDRAPHEIHLTIASSTERDPHNPCAPAQGFRS